METTKLDRLKKLSYALLECKQECVSDAEEWQVYDDIQQRIDGLITGEQHHLGYMAVYPIMDGCSQEAVFTGTPESCQLYIDIYLEAHPEAKGNFVILPI